MKNYLKICWLMGLVVLALQLSAQTRIGQWRDFYSYSNIISFDLQGDLAFCAARNGLFSLKSDGATEYFSKTEQLIDIDIQLVGIDPSTNIAVVAYKSGFIDLIDNGKVRTIRSVQESAAGEQRFNAIAFADGFAYLATSFGVLKLNIAKREIAETYYLGEGGTETEVLDICYSSAQNSLFIITGENFQQGTLDGRNLMDFANWQTIDANLLSAIEAFDGKIYAIQKQSSSALLAWDGNGWESVTQSFNTISDLRSVNGSLFVTDVSSAYELSGNSWSLLPDFIDGQWSAARFSSNRKVLSASRFEGVYLNDLQIKKEGSTKNSFISISSKNKILKVCGNSFANEFSEKNWLEDEQTEHFEKVIQGKKNSTWLLHADGSIYQWNGTEKQQKINASANDITFDSKNQLWFANNSSTYQIGTLGSDEQLLTFSNGLLQNKNFDNLLIAESGDLWMLNNGRVYVFETEGNQAKSFVAYNESSNLISDHITCLAEDQDGSIWCGSDNGVLLYSNPWSMFNDGTIPAAYRAVAESDGEAAYLLADEAITEITIDGGNRKWIGTANSGVYLVSETGNGILKHFTTSNSPLPSDNVLQISIDNLSGEVFVLTDGGLVSYRAEANEAKTNFEGAYAFPNPVRPNYSGPITITGLMNQTQVKITDASGNLVHETTSLGGQAIWDGRTLAGGRAATGVYFAFLVSEDGAQKGTVKVLFIN